MNLAGHVEEFGRTLGEELLEPTRIYAKDCLALAAETQVRTFCHVTGGGLAGNLERVIPHGLVAELDRGTWTPAPVFTMIAQRGRIDRAEMEKTFNMGVGMVAVVAPEDTDRALAILTARHLTCWTLGTVARGKTAHERRSWASTHGFKKGRRLRAASRPRRSTGRRRTRCRTSRVRSRPNRPAPYGADRHRFARAVFQLSSNLGLLRLSPAAPMGEPPRAITERPEIRRLRSVCWLLSCQHFTVPRSDVLAGPFGRP